MLKETNTINYSDASIDDLALHAVISKVQYNLAVQELKRRLKGKDRDHVRSVLLPFYSMVYGVGVVDNKLDNKASEYENCRKALLRTTKEILTVDATKKPKDAAPKKKMRIAKEVRESALGFLAQFDSVSQAIAILKQVA